MPLGPEHRDVFAPELQHEATVDDKISAYNQILDIVCADSFMAKKAKASLVLIFTAGVPEEPPPEQPLAAKRAVKNAN